MASPREVLLLALADDELVLGHRHQHWTGVAPHLEEDLAFSSIAQDEIGHAAVWYGLAADDAGGADGGRPQGGGDPVDVLALGRPVDAYRHAVICEAENGDWGFTIARHLCYDLAEDVRLEVLARSADRPIAEATGALLREERHHLLHARTWLAHLADGPAEARERLTAGLTSAVPLAAGLFETLPDEDALLADGTLPEPHAVQLRRWAATLAAELAPYGMDHLVDLAPRVAQPGGRHGLHSELWPALWDEMTALYRSEPAARW